MALYGDLTHDSRVIREADTLAAAGLGRPRLLARGVTAGRFDVRVGGGPGRTDPRCCPTEAARSSGRRPDLGSRGSVRGLPGRSATPGPFAPGAGASSRLAGDVDVWHVHDLTGLLAVGPLVRSPIRTGVRQSRGVPGERDRHAAAGNAPPRAPEVRAAPDAEGGGARHRERQHGSRPRVGACGRPRSSWSGTARRAGRPPQAIHSACGRPCTSRPTTRSRCTTAGSFPVAGSSCFAEALLEPRRRARPRRAPRLRPDAR